MQKIGASTASANALGEFTEGNPGAGIDATLLKAAWLNAIQRELVHLVEGAGLILDTADDSQILKAITVIQERASSWLKLTDKPTTVAGFGLTDVFTKTETTSAIQQRVAELVASSPAALDTLKELADALGNDPNFASTMTSALAGKANKATTLGGYGITDAYPKTGTYSRVEFDELFKTQATEINQGTTKVATAAQMLDSANDFVMPTPKKLRWGFSISLAANGYIAFPTWLGGLVIQWGASVGFSSTPAAVTFPMAFPTAVFAVVATNYAGATNIGVTQDSVASFGLSTAGVSFKTFGGAVPNGAKYIAIGS